MEATWYEQAKGKLQATFGKIHESRAKAMAGPVRDALLSFADQNEEFAQAIAQGGDFDKCMTAVAKGVGSSISDIEAYRRAVQFYFDGATIHMEMRIQLEPEEDSAPLPSPAPEKKSGGMTLSLDDFL